MKIQIYRVAILSLFLILSLNTTTYARPDLDAYRTIHILFVGDIMTHEPQIKAHLLSGASYDFSPQFTEIAEIISSADIAIGNLETTFGGEKKRYTGYPRFNTPDILAQNLKDIGFDVLVTANNHCIDTGISGMDRTIAVLDSEDIAHTGTFASGDLGGPLILKTGGVRLALLSYSYSTNGITVPEKRRGSVNLISNAKISADVYAARASADVLILFMHWGNEYQQKQSKNQEKIAAIAFKAGADMIIGSHPHVIQPMGIISDDKFVAYSLGNFISSQRTIPRETGMALDIELDMIAGGKPVIKSINFTPTWVQYGWKKTKKVIRVLPIPEYILNAKGKEKEGLVSKQEILRMKQAQEQLLKIIYGKNKPTPSPDGESFIFWRKDY